MKQLESVLYIPGLGDNKSYGQDLLPFLWKIYGLKAEYWPVKWSENNFQQKLDKLESRIRTLSVAGRVSLVGSSAGASAILNLFARIPLDIHKIVTICGKIQNPQNIQPSTLEKNPNFGSSMALLPDSLDRINNNMRKNILCIRPISDEVVAPEDAVIDGAESYTLNTRGHVLSIAYALTLGSRTIANFIRND